MVRGTFFVLGWIRGAATQPSWRDIVDAGHEISPSHGDTHRRVYGT